MKDYRCGQWLLMIILISLWYLPGCATTEPSKFYLLHSMKTPSSEQVDHQVARGLTIGIGPVEIPEYLNRPQIVTRTSRNELHLSEFHQWAEPLEDNISRVLAENLSMLLGTDNVVIFPWERSTPVRYQVAVEVVHFEGAKTEHASLNARWRILDEDSQKVLMNEKHNFTKEVSDDGYEALVSAESELLSDLSREIASAIEKLSRERSEP